MVEKFSKVWCVFHSECFGGEYLERRRYFELGLVKVSELTFHKVFFILNDLVVLGGGSSEEPLVQ